MSSSQGVHIVFEGPDAVGKSTQIKRTFEYFQEKGYQVVLTREPGGTTLGESLRSILLDSDLDIDYRAEALIMAADRAQNVSQVIIPALERGDIVLSDRYIPSSLVYQGIVRGLGTKEVSLLSEFATAGHQPDIIVCFDLEDAIARERVTDDPDRIEREGDRFQQQIRDAYRVLSRDTNWGVVDAGGTQDEVFKRILDLIEPIIVNKAVSNV